MIKKGQILIAAIFVLVIFLVFGMVVASILSSESVSVVKNLYGVQALFVAEGGMHFTILTSLEEDSDWSNNSDFGPVSLGPGSFTVHYVTKAKRNCNLQVTGTVNGVSRTVGALFRKGGLPGQFTDFGIYAGRSESMGDNVRFYNDSKIIGSFYYYGPLQIMGSRPPACQTGGTIYSASIDPAPDVGIPNYYESWEAIDDIDPVYWDNTHYDNMLTLAASNAAGSLTLSGTQTLNLNGETQWYRGISVQDNAKIIGPGTICATAMPSGTGDFNIEDDAVVTGEVHIVARDDFKMQNSARLLGTVEVIAKDNFDMDHNSSTSFGCILYTRKSGSAVFNMNNDAIARGSVLCPYGEVVLRTNTQLQGLAYANSFQAYDRGTLEGGAVFYDIANFYNRSMVIQNNEILPPTLPEGLSAESSSGGFEFSNWGIIY
jgi:hypothetical protein